MTDPPITLGEYLKTIRLQQGLSLTKAAKRMKMTPQKLSDIECGRRYGKNVSLKMVTTFSVAYGIPIATLIRNVETAVHTEKSVSELLLEIIPHARFAELLAKNVMNESKSFSTEHETNCIELYNKITELRALVNLMRKRQFNTDTETTLDVSPSEEMGPV